MTTDRKMKIEITDESDAFIILNAIKYVRTLYDPSTMTRHAIDHLIETFEKELKEKEGERP